MLEFMNTPSCNHYYLVHRIKDCEKNLTAFNYATPMAICIEAKKKNILHLYDKSLDIQDIERRQLTDLLNDQKIISLLKEEFNIPPHLLSDIDRGIRKKNNDYKHSLEKVQKASPPMKKDYFRQFYAFSSKYYEHFSGKQAPDWNDASFDLLISNDIDVIRSKQEHLMKVEVQNEH